MYTFLQFWAADNNNHKNVGRPLYFIRGSSAQLYFQGSWFLIFKVQEYPTEVTQQYKQSSHCWSDEQLGCLIYISPYCLIYIDDVSIHGDIAKRQTAKFLYGHPDTSVWTDTPVCPDTSVCSDNPVCLDTSVCSDTPVYPVTQFI